MTIVRAKRYDGNDGDEFKHWYTDRIQRRAMLKATHDLGDMKYVLAHRGTPSNTGSSSILHLRHYHRDQVTDHLDHKNYHPECQAHQEDLHLCQNQD